MTISAFMSVRTYVSSVPSSHTFEFCCHRGNTKVQQLNIAYKWLLNKPYENEVTLTEQNPPLKYCQPLELLTQLKKGLDLLMLKIWGLLVKGLKSYQLSKLEVSRKSLPLWPFQPICVQAHSARVRTRARSNHFQSLTAGNFEAL